MLDFVRMRFVVVGVAPFCVRAFFGVVRGEWSWRDILWKMGVKCDVQMNSDATGIVAPIADDVDVVCVDCMSNVFIIGLGRAHHVYSKSST